MDNFPLLELFTRLREAGLLLGIDDYQAVLKALQAGWGIEDQAALARLCCTLWIKSKKDKKLFDYHFEQIIIQPSDSINNATIINTSIPTNEQHPPKNIQISQNKSFRISSYFTFLLNYLIPVSIFILFYVIIIKTWKSNHTPVFKSPPIKYVKKSESYKYQIKVYDIDNGDKLKIEAVRCPSWLTFESNKNGTATLSGTEGKTVGNCPSEKDKTAPVEDSSKKKPKSYTVELQVTDEYGATSRQNFKIKVVDETPSNVTEYPIWFLLLFLFILFAVVYAISRKGTNTEPSDEPNSASLKQGKTVTDNSPPEELVKTSDERKVEEAGQKTSQPENVKPLNRFIQLSEYPPVTRRQMKQSWRYLRRMLREGAPTELDVEATVECISRQGVLLEPVIIPRRINRSKLLLLIDQDGSMMPFQNLSHQLAETAVRGGRLEETDIYFFHNCPMDYLYRDRYYQMAQKIEDVITCLSSSYTALLIFSDAGAARGGFNPERLEVTAQFLEQLRQQVRHIAWLNPMPRYRWVGTTAGKIAQLVPMFELSRQGLYNAIAVLRGQSGHFGTAKL